jgi:type VI protein secretion system component VasK
MTRRSRIIGFGSAGILVVAGVIGAVVVNGTPGQLLAIVLIALGLILATALVFLEIGLSEDRERAQEEARQPRQPPQAPHPPSAEERRARPRLERLRGSRRRLG